MLKRILITGVAGFIGFHLAKKLLALGYYVAGFDNLNNYYDISLKRNRLKLLEGHDDFFFEKGDLSDYAFVDGFMLEHRPEIVINLAAQAGVRFSIESPRNYIDSNIIGFFNLLESCRKHPVAHLIFASSSSVYGNRNDAPFKTSDKVDSPISLYAATKVSNELMAYTYSHLYKIPSTGLRFFTVYGPWGRPDMAYYKFAKLIMQGEPINIYNNGDMIRDFTYIDDIVLGIEKTVLKPPEENENGVKYKVYNLGGSRPENLMDFINMLETALGKTSKKVFLPMQPGDVYMTCADSSEFENDFGFCPKVSVKDGIKDFAEWFKRYYSQE